MYKVCENIIINNILVYNFDSIYLNYCKQRTLKLITIAYEGQLQTVNAIIGVTTRQRNYYYTFYS